MKTCPGCESLVRIGTSSYCKYHKKDIFAPSAAGCSKWRQWRMTKIEGEPDEIYCKSIQEIAVDILATVLLVS